MTINAPKYQHIPTIVHCVLYYTHHLSKSTSTCCMHDNRKLKLLYHLDHLSISLLTRSLVAFGQRPRLFPQKYMLSSSRLTSESCTTINIRYSVNIIQKYKKLLRVFLTLCLPHYYHRLVNLVIIGWVSIRYRGQGKPC